MRALDTWRDVSGIVGCLKEEGIEAVGRYYSKSAWKTLKKPEADELSAHGIKIWVVYQDANNEYSKFSEVRGRSAAERAIKYASKTIGQPNGTAIYFAVDYDASPAQVDGKIKDYFEAVSAVLNENGNPYYAGVYGNGTVCQRLLDWGLVKFTWLNMSTGHHGHAEFYKSKRWSLRQRLPKTLCGIDVDPDELNPSVDFGGFVTSAANAVPSAASDVSASASLSASDGGTERYVKTEGLNFRKDPDGDIIRTLTIGDPVQLLDEADDDWVHVKVGEETGYVFAAYLRLPAYPSVESLLRNAITEWVRFDKGRADEKSDPYFKYVGEMWKSIGQSYDGKSVYPNGEDVPWSAAFISFVVGKSGVKYSDFMFADAHSEFTHDSIQARILDRTDRPFWGYRISEAKPEIGDIVARNRAGNSFSFDYAENHSQFKSHSDFVVEVRNDTIRVLGGNVSDSVSMKGDLQEYDLNAEGFVKPGQKVIAILKNRSHQV